MLSRESMPEALLIFIPYAMFSYFPGKFRLLFSLMTLVSVLLLPWWITSLLALIGMILLPRFFEAPIAAVLAQILYGSSDIEWYRNIILISIIVFILVEIILKPRLRI